MFSTKNGSRNRVKNIRELHFLDQEPGWKSSVLFVPEDLHKTSAASAARRLARRLARVQLLSDRRRRFTLLGFWQMCHV